LNAGEGLEVEVRSSWFTAVLVLAVVLVLEIIVHSPRFAVRRGFAVYSSAFAAHSLGFAGEYSAVT
jgi:hypothetical protein